MEIVLSDQDGDPFVISSDFDNDNLVNLNLKDGNGDHIDIQVPLTDLNCAISSFMKKRDILLKQDYKRGLIENL